MSVRRLHVFLSYQLFATWLSELALKENLVKMSMCSEIVGNKDFQSIIKLGVHQILYNDIVLDKYGFPNRYGCYPVFIWTNTSAIVC